MVKIVKLSNSVNIWKIAPSTSFVHHFWYFLSRSSKSSRSSWFSTGDTGWWKEAAVSLVHSCFQLLHLIINQSLLRAPPFKKEWKAPPSNHQPELRAPPFKKCGKLLHLFINQSWPGGRCTAPPFKSSLTRETCLEKHQSVASCNNCQSTKHNCSEASNLLSN